MKAPRAVYVRVTAAALALLTALACTGETDARGPDAPPATTQGPPPPVPKRTPNVLIILTDDQRVDTLGRMNRTRFWFKDGGTEFTNAFATTPVCCPSRASILTGRYAHNHGVLTNEHAGEFSEDDSLARHLNDQGYFTAMAGKYLNLWPADKPPAHFDRWAMIPDFDYRQVYYGWQANLDGEMVGEQGEYSTDFIAKTAVDFLADFESEDDDNPWFLYLAPYAPHQPATPEPKYSEAIIPYFIANPSVRERDRSDKPPRVRSDQAGGVAQAKVARIAQLRALRSVDDMVHRVMSVIKRLDEDRDTIAFFMSDNGFMWGEHNLNSKRWQYLPSIRIPLYARWPDKVEAGATDPRVAANIDIAPTVIDALGLWPNNAYRMDGRSLLGDAPRQRLLLENWFYRRGSGTWAATITRKYHYIESYDDAGEKLEFQEYYDLRRDPWQLVNLLADGNPRNDPDADALSEQLTEDRVCPLGDCP